MAPHTARRTPHSPSPRGSVLVFAVVLLALLAGVVTAFLLFVRQEYHASGNALRNVQSEQAAEAGLEHALRAVRQAVLNYQYYTPDGAWVATGSLAEHAYIYTSAGYAGTAPASYPASGPPRFFEYAGDQPTDAHAWLWYNTDATVFPNQVTEPAPATVFPDLTFTANMLAECAARDGSAKRNFDNGPLHQGLARRFEMKVDLGRFYPREIWNPSWRKSLPEEWRTWDTVAKAPTEPRHAGEYYVWVADLDGKLSAETQRWGLSAVGTGDDDQAVARNIISLVALNAGMYVSPDALWNVPQDSLSSVGELSLVSGFITSTTSSDWLNTRRCLDRYFTVRLDSAKGAKEQPAALNINAANYETLVAALSRVPLVDNFKASDAASVTANQQKAQALAARICAKRPFLGRMDFEDFLAAHLNADPAQAADPVTDLTKPVGMISAALVKRVENQLLPYEALDLDQFGASSATTLPADVNTRAFMQARLTFFRQESTLPGAQLQPALISPKAFNNILNSISGKRRNDTYGYSYYSFDDVDTPFSTTGGTPKLLYNEFGSPIPAGGLTYVIERGNTADSNEAGELKSWSATNGRGYYEMAFSACDDRQLVDYDETVMGLTEGDRVDFVDGGAALETTPLAGDLSDTKVYELADAAGSVHCDTYIHAPLRAYRVCPPDIAAEAPAAARTDGPLTNGDVSWSPRFCFRSRFFAVYVLARGMTDKGSYGPTKRLEAVYDALTDKVLWRRWQTTELRNLGDPSP